MTQIRLARATDARLMAQMSRELIEAGLGWRWTPARMLRAMRDAETNAIVACAQSRLVGFAVMHYGETSAHLLLLAVAPDRRRRGVGRALWDWLLASARVAGIADVRLELRAGNSVARRFYHALGCVEGVTVRGYYAGVEAALQMHCKLRRDGPSGASAGDAGEDSRTR
jgi:ribosomal-protein-alanine N-acetyltransferase